MVGIILGKERKIPDPASDRLTFEFLKRMVIDLGTSRGIAERTRDVLLDFAGVVALVSDQVHIKEVLQDIDRIEEHAAKAMVYN